MSDATPERWLPIPGYEGYYEVSDWGRIQSLRRMTRCGWRGGGILKGQPLRRTGYLQVALWKNNVRQMVYVHTLVLLAFTGPCPFGQETRHWDGDPANNHLSNLIYGTGEENAQDTARLGRTVAGARHPLSKLIDDDVLKIRTMWQRGARVTDLAAQFGVSKPTVSRIVAGASYRSVPILQRERQPCGYPECENLAQEGTDKRGLSLKFCENPGHYSQAARDERARRKAA